MSWCLKNSCKTFYVMGHWFVYGIKLFQAFNNGYYSNAAELLLEAERGLIQSGI
jgi:hypothetical protein